MKKILVCRMFLRYYSEYCIHNRYTIFKRIAQRFEINLNEISYSREFFQNIVFSEIFVSPFVWIKLQYSLYLVWFFQNKYDCYCFI